MEIWKWIDGFEGKYEVSNLGNVRSYVTPRLLRPFKKKNGYVGVKLSGGAELAVHRLVADAFIPNTGNLPEVNHRDCQKWNNAVYNLEWVTHQQNIQHAADNGLLAHRKVARGSAANKSHLTDADVKTIRARYEAGGCTHKSLGKDYGVDAYTIYAIINRKTWTHI